MDIPEVIFDEETHTYTEAGVVIPRSVTGLLKKYGLTTDFSMIPPGVLFVAAQRGRAFAAGRTFIVQGVELDPATIDPRISGYVQAFEKFWRESGAKLIETEVPRVSPLGFGFRADIICWIGGRRAVVDDKATFKMPKSVGPQTAGYKIGWNSLFPKEAIEDRYGLWVKKDGTYKLIPLDDNDDINAFLEILDFDLKVEKWQKKYGGKQ